MSRCRSVGISPEVLEAMSTSLPAWRLTSASMRCFRGSCSGMFSWMKSARCAITLRSVVKESLPLGGSGALVSRASAGSAFATAPRIHSSISGFTSAAMTSIPKCSARAAHPPPMTPVPNRPSVLTFLIASSLAGGFCNVTSII